MREKTCCFTGHRDIPSAILPILSTELNPVLEQLIGQGICSFCAGGALGFDTLAAEMVLRWNARYPHIQLILVLPCHEQTNRWKQADIQRYHRILRSADQTNYTSEHYFPGCMHLRNRRLVESSSICVAYCVRDTGGSAYTVNYAAKQRLQIIRLMGTNPNSK